MPKLRKKPHITAFNVVNYTQNDNGWYETEQRRDNPLPLALQRQSVIQRQRIKTDQVISNFRWFTGLEHTNVQELYTGDRRTDEGKQLLVIRFHGDYMSVYIFQGYLSAPAQRRRFAESFFAHVLKTAAR